LNHSKEMHRLISLEKLLSGRQFIIPEYQRGYSWETDQRKDLLDDIQHIGGVEYKHFTGTIVACETGSANVYEIVDGQQRLTTLIILVNEILRSDKTELTEAERQSLHSLINYHQGNRNDRVLTLSQEVDGFYRRHIITGLESEAEEILVNKSRRNLAEARREFKQWVDENYQPHYLDVIKKQLGFLFFQPEKKDTVGIMFEVINNRGKSLSELEKIKNYLIYYAIARNNKTLEAKIVDTWPAILKNLMAAGIETNEEENSFLRNCWILFYTTDKSKSYQVYKYLKREFNPRAESNSDNQIEALLGLLKSASAAYKDLQQKDSEILELIRHQPVNASIIPLYLAICLCVSEESKTELLSILEKLNFRTYIIPDVTKRADTYQGDLFWFAKHFYHKNVSYKANLPYPENDDPYGVDALRLDMINFIQANAPVRKIVEGLTLDANEDYNYHGWIGLFYFLANYEYSHFERKRKRIAGIMQDNYGSKFSSHDRFEREHIWAWDNRSDSFISNEDKHEKKRLGNFVLLEKGINASIKNADITAKILDYTSDQNGSQFMMVRELQSQFAKAKEMMDPTGRVTHIWWLCLHAHINDIREEKMVNWALKRWYVEGDPVTKVTISSFPENQYLLKNSGLIKKNPKIYRGV